jgi:hypothetical protein
MKNRPYLSIIVFLVFIISLACNFSTPTEVPTSIPENNTQIPTAASINPSSPHDDLCKNQYMPIINDSTKIYEIKTTVAGSTKSTTNYENLSYYDDRDNFSVMTRLGGRLGPPFWDEWACTTDGLIRTSFGGGDFSAFFKDENDNITNTATTDWCPGGITLPISIHAGNTWTQQTDFKFTSSNLTGWNWFKWNILHRPLNAQALPLPAGSGRFIYKYKAIGFEQVIVPAGTYHAFRIDVAAEGYLDPSRDFSPTFKSTGCGWSPNQVDEIDPEMSLTFEGSTWWARDIGWVKKIGTVSNSQGVIESYEMKLESSDVP